ncbi:head-tail connector protein [Sphingomonas naphthae]|uniref:Head-tail connector protein n=1 Tax=Sphingomonas naphthae TaxID=1813468 RepID=A0ABY7TL30_9SPHN|nr:head-tail connector protein [Sphingomonas naphthae]WCT73673.1 head-tail connector protein [Sphingomonas naphthae]
MGEAVSLAAVKAYLRIEGDEDDDLLGRLIATAEGLCEGFIGQVLIRRAMTEEIAAPGWWHPLGVWPIVAITAVEEVTSSGAVALPVAAYAVDIDPRGDGLVRVTVPGIGRIRVTYTAGIAADAEALPAGLAQGIVRLVAHLHAHRDEADEAGPPAAVAALWRPWRRMRL